MNYRILLICCLFISLSCNSQNTKQLAEDAQSPNASLNDVTWLAGHWKGEAFGGIAEEIWSPPLGDSMMFSFKLVSDGKTQFYELGAIRQIENTLILQLKHFNGDLTAWEEKQETVDFKLVEIDGNRIYFSGFTIEKISAKEINMYVVIGEKDGSKQELKFNYHRQ